MGHIKHKKGALGRQARQDFYPPDQEISMPPRCGDPDTNPRLRGAYRGARPRTCLRTTSSGHQRGTGELPARPTRILARGYGPGVAIRSTSILTIAIARSAKSVTPFGKNGGNMAEAGAVSWMFHQEGDIVIPRLQPRKRSDGYCPRSRRRRFAR